MVGAGVGKDVKAMRCIAVKMLMAMLVVMLVLVSMSIHVAVVVFMIMRVLMMMMMGRFGRLVLYNGILAGLKIEDARSCGISTSAMFAH